MTEWSPEALIERVAKALDDNYNPDKYPIMAAMFRDYAATAISAIEANDSARIARLMAYVTPLGYSSALALIEAEANLLALSEAAKKARERHTR